MAPLRNKKKEKNEICLIKKEDDNCPWKCHYKNFLPRQYTKNGLKSSEGIDQTINLAKLKVNMVNWAIRGEHLLTCLIL